MKKVILVGLSILALSLNTSCGKDDDPAPEPEVVEINGFSPASGEVGTEVTINGKNFSTTKTENIVTFNGTSTEVKNATASQLTVIVPNEATTGVIKVTVGNSSATSNSDFKVLVPTVSPTIVEFEPKYGVIGTEVAIIGTNFSDQATVKFGDKEAQVTSTSETELVVKVPDGSVTGPISITVEGQSVTTPDDFTVYDPTSLTLTPNVDYTQDPAFEIGEIVELEISVNAPSGLSELVISKKINGGEPVTVNIPQAPEPGVSTFTLGLEIPVQENFNDEVQISVAVTGVADIAYHTQTFSYTVAAQGQGGSGGKYLKLHTASGIDLGSQGNVDIGSYYATSANTVYMDFDGVSEQDQTMVDITFGTILSFPNLISPDQRANKGLNNALGGNATNTTFKNEGSELDFDLITSTDVANIDHSEGAVSNLLIAEGVYYSFVNASGKKGMILINSITDNGADNKVVNFNILVQE